MKIETVLFDLDGTIVNSNELILASFRHTFATYGLTFTDEELFQFNGPPLQETFAKIGSASADEMVETYRVFNFAQQEKYIELFPGVVETIERLLAAGIKIAIVTSKMRDSVQLGMGLTDIDQYFDTVITLDDVIQSKPHPEGVIKAMKALDADAASTIIVGDNYHDILAGQHAGIRTAGVAWSQKGEAYLQSYKPTYMLQTMPDLLTLLGV